MFKLIALRPLKGCSPWVLKCLSEDVTYYFCNDYQIQKSEGRYTVSFRKGNVTTIDDNFFSIRERWFSRATISVGAIVGKNGDGKSSVVELLMRILNNYILSVDVGLNSYHIEGVCADLFYQVDDAIFWLSCMNRDFSLTKIARIESKVCRGCNAPVTKEDWTHDFFYTFVFNFSHYAYNVYDFEREWNLEDNGDDVNQKCWLQHIFHKNDAYTAPLNINPYRDRGNIDVNREKNLSRQRLLSLFVNADDGRANHDSFRVIGEEDKVATLAVLHPIGYSKLQERIIKQRFAGYAEDSLLQGYVDSAVYDEKGRKDLNAERDIVHELSNIYDGIISKVKDELPKIFEWDDYRNRYVRDETEFSKLLAYIQMYDEDSDYADKLKEVVDEYDEVKAFNLKQIQVLVMIHDVIDALRAELSDPKYTQEHPYLLGLRKALDRYADQSDFLIKDFEEMNVIEKALHYVIYKVISIFDTYAEYHDCLAAYLFELKQEVNLSAAVKHLLNDIDEDRSHITLKIRQTLSYIALNLNEFGLDDNNDQYKDSDTVENKDAIIAELYEEGQRENRFLVTLDSLKSIAANYDLDQLPPPLYDTEIVLEPMAADGMYFLMSSLSSGEKQLLVILSSVIYHLRNLEAHSKGSAEYENINIIMEETELYFHPECQRSIVYRLIKQIENVHFTLVKRVSILFVTHSPFVLSDIPVSNVLFLEKGAPSEKDVKQTFGANISDMLRWNFFLNNGFIGAFAAEKINHFAELVAKNRNGNYNKRNKTKVQKAFRELKGVVGEPLLRNQIYAAYTKYMKAVEGEKELIKELRALIKELQ